jgi:uncharacterized protein
MGLAYGKALPLQSKQAGDDWIVEGYLSTYGNIDDGNDVVLPGAFDATLASDRKVKFLFAHNQEKVLGPPLELSTDDVGLRARGRISKTALGSDIHTLLLDGAIDAWSMGYLATEWDFQDVAGRGQVRRLKAVDLFEGSVLALPMNERAVVTGVKAADEGEAKPYPTEHACRLRDPDDFQADSFRRVSREHDGKSYDVILGKLQGDDALTEQAYRYPVETWDADAARAHCRDHEGSLFEPAADGKAACDCAHEPPDPAREHKLAATEQAIADAAVSERSWDVHADDVLTVLESGRVQAIALVTRGRVHRDVRQKEGRPMSAARRQRLLEERESLAAVLQVLDQLLEETAPPPKGYRIPQADLTAVRLRVAGLILPTEAHST